MDIREIDLKERRKMFKKTQADVAREVGVSLSTYLLWERKVGRPTKENERKLISVLSLWTEWTDLTESFEEA